jgi:hypothetical protein
VVEEAFVFKSDDRGDKGWRHLIECAPLNPLASAVSGDVDGLPISIGSLFRAPAGRRKLAGREGGEEPARSSDAREGSKCKQSREEPASMRHLKNSSQTLTPEQPPERVEYRSKLVKWPARLVICEDLLGNRVVTVL